MRGSGSKPRRWPPVADSGFSRRSAIVARIFSSKLEKMPPVADHMKPKHLGDPVKQQLPIVRCSQVYPSQTSDPAHI